VDIPSRFGPNYRAYDCFGCPYCLRQFIVRSVYRAQRARGEGSVRSFVTDGRTQGGVVEEERVVSTAGITRQHGSEDVHQQPETSDLQHGIRPVEDLPAESKTDNPDRDSPACVGDTPHSGGYVLGDAKTEEVEEANGERDGDGRANKDAWVIDGPVPSAGEVEERRACGD